MTKKEQMLDMMKIFREASSSCEYGMDCPYMGESNVHCVYCTLAEPLYNAGCRKVDGTHYVSMEWHNEQVEQAVRDFAEKLKTSIKADEDMYQQAEDCSLYPEDFVSKIDELLEEYDK